MVFSVPKRNTGEKFLEACKDFDFNFEVVVKIWQESQSSSISRSTDTGSRFLINQPKGQPEDLP